MHVEQSYCECLFFARDGKQRFSSYVPTSGCACILVLGRFLLFCFSFPFSWELGNVLLSHNLVRGWRNSGISTNEDFSHVWLRTLSFTPPVRGGGGYGVTSGYLKDRLDPWGTKGKF